MREQYEGRPLFSPARAQDFVAQPIQTFDQPRHQPLIMLAHALDALPRHVLHRGRPRHVVEEIRGPEHVVLAPLQPGLDPRRVVADLPTEVEIRFDAQGEAVSKTVAAVAAQRREAELDAKRKAALNHPRVRDAVDVFPESAGKLAVHIEAE